MNMKLKTSLIPLVGLTSVASVTPLIVSCGKTTIYDSPINLKELIANRKNFKRLTERYNKKEEINKFEANSNYVSAVKHNKYVFNDDIFEDMVASPIWDDQGNNIEGSLLIKDVAIEQTTTINGVSVCLLSASADLDSVDFKLDKPLAGLIYELGCDGKITFTKVPFEIYYDIDGTYSKWRFKILTEGFLDALDLWSISADAKVKINEDIGNVSFTWNKETISEEIIGEWMVETLLGLVHFDLYYYKGIGCSE